MTDISLDKSRAVRIKARINESSVPQIFTFTNEDGSPHDITGYDFRIFVQKRANSNVKLFTLSVGAGLTVQGDDNNELLIEVTASQASQIADSYFWRLYSVDEDHTWLNGPWEFHNGEHDAVVENEEINIVANGDTVNITISSATVIGSEIDHWRGVWDPSGGLPVDADAIGSGSGGVILGGDTVIFSSTGDIGGENWPTDTMAIAKQNSPTLSEHWRLF